MEEVKRNAWLKWNLRKVSIRWPARSQVLKAAKSTVQEGFFKNGNPKMRAKYLCSGCKSKFGSKEVQVDHIDPVGECADWNVYIDRLFCAKENLQILCKTCHKEKTRNES